MDAYVEAVLRALAPWRERLRGRELATVYFGGGTPSLLGARRLGPILDAVREGFALSPGAEVTLEANPTQVDRDFFKEVRQAGFNRLSMGLQSADPPSCGCWAGPTPGRTRPGCGGRPGGRLCEHLPGPDAGASGRFLGDAEALHFLCCFPGGGAPLLLHLKSGAGHALCRPGGSSFPTTRRPPGSTCSWWRSWTGWDTPSMRSATSPAPAGKAATTCCTGGGRSTWASGRGPLFFEGRRFYYPRDLKAFLQGDPPVEDGPGGDFGEFAMLNLRLARGLRREDCLARFGPEGGALFEKVLENARRWPSRLLRREEGSLSFTPEGFWSPTPCWCGCWEKSCKREKRASTGKAGMLFLFLRKTAMRPHPFFPKSSGCIRL